jgi:hypothetical protein
VSHAEGAAPDVCRRATAPPILRANAGDRGLEYARLGPRADLPADGPLPCRTALVPGGARAAARAAPPRSGRRPRGHAVRVGRVAASKVLRAAGVHATPGEDVLRRLRVLRLIIPRVTIGLFAARPRRTHYLQRMAALFGDAAAAALDAATVPRSRRDRARHPHLIPLRAAGRARLRGARGAPGPTARLTSRSMRGSTDRLQDRCAASGIRRAELPGYVAQVRAYGALLAACGAARDRSIRTGLLFSADGSIHWV